MDRRKTIMRLASRWDTTGWNTSFRFSSPAHPRATARITLQSVVTSENICIPLFRYFWMHFRGKDFLSSIMCMLIFGLEGHRTGKRIEKDRTEGGGEGGRNGNRKVPGSQCSGRQTPQSSTGAQRIQGNDRNNQAGERGTDRPDKKRKQKQKEYKTTGHFFFPSKPDISLIFVPFWQRSNVLC